MKNTGIYIYIYQDRVSEKMKNENKKSHGDDDKWHTRQKSGYGQG